jgi:hypothetical protein
VIFLSGGLGTILLVSCPKFKTDVKSMMADFEREALIAFLAANRSG